MRTPHCHPTRTYYAKGMCRWCYEKSLREINSEFLASQQENSRQWAIKNKTKKKALDKKYQANSKNKERGAKRNRAKVLASFGMTLDDEIRLLTFQKNVCGICGNVVSWESRYRLDHDHETGLLRGLLCGKCNSGLGMLGDNLPALLRAINYLKNPPAEAFKNHGN